MSNHRAGSTRSTGARRNFARAAAAILLGLTLSSCSFTPSLEKDESARAIFDVENDKVILPLDAYNTDGKDEYFTKALELARKKCFAEHGQHYEMFVRTEGSGRNLGRTYGIWNVEHAKNTASTSAKTQIRWVCPPLHPHPTPGRMSAPNAINAPAMR